MLLHLPTLHLKIRGLWKQEGAHGKQFTAGATSAPHTRGFRPGWRSDVQDALALHSVLMLSLRQLLQRLVSGGWRPSMSPHCHGQAREPLPTLVFLLQEALGIAIHPQTGGSELPNDEPCMCVPVL